MENLVDFSYDQDNKEEQIFFEAWEAAEKGTVITYDGYLKSKAKRKIIKSYDPMTGEIETDEEEVESDNQCINFIIPLVSLYIKDFHIFDIQKQPSICWIERMNPREFENEFKKYPNYKYVKTSPQLITKGEQDTYFTKEWQDRTDDDEPIEVIRYFNKPEDEFIILANGVKIFNSPLILGKKKKWYPFAKTVFEPFATDFFYGNSLPNTLMGEQDVINALFNMSLDKTYKSMAANLLIGNVNKDDFDLEDQNTTIDTKIYVQDINQVKEMPIKGIDQSDFKMIELVSRGLDLSSVDSNQQGVPGRGVTAREVVIANENAKKLKGIVYLFLTSLWIQKIKLRIMNILTYFTQPKVDKAIGEKGAEYQTFMVEGAELSSGLKGTLGIQMVGSKEQLPKQQDLDIDEETMKMRSGENYELLSITSDYLDDWIYDIKVESESIYQQESGLTQSKMEDKLRMIATYFPQLLTTNAEKLFNDTIISYDDDPNDYEAGAMPQIPGITEEQQPATATAGQTGLTKLPPL